MLFSLEALEAKHGDCLLLHYGTTNDPKLIIIDGGPPGVYSTRLKPRLEQLAGSRVAADGALPVRLLMVSHIDEDHVEGIERLTNDMVRAADDGDQALLTIDELWHNSFSDLVKPLKPAEIEKEGGGVTLASLDDIDVDNLPDTIAHSTTLVLTSVKQGRNVRNNAKKLALQVNRGFAKGLVIAPQAGKLTRSMGDGLSFTIIGPAQDQLDALQDEWANEIARLKKEGKLKPADVNIALAEFVDDSAPNLSSIVVLAKVGGKTMLLTGDARGDFIMKGLEAGGLKAVGKPFRVDLLKMPHHGSQRNIEDVFFAEITADHYVLSANGKFDNPDLGTAEALYRVRPQGGYTVHLTNEKHFKTGAVLPAAQHLVDHAPPGVKVVFGDPTLHVPSVVVDLGDALQD